MSFTDHKITQFQHRIVDLPDQPTLPPDELKARFDSSAEELRVALGAVCDDADRLDARVAGIVAETFGDSIDKSMLSDELQDEIDAKATQTALAAEAAAREATDAEVAKKCEIYFGTYTGDGADSQFIELGFTPQAIMTCPQAGNGDLIGGNRNSYGGLALPNTPAKMEGRMILGIENNGFRAYGDDSGSYPPYIRANCNGMIFFYWAIK